MGLLRVLTRLGLPFLGGSKLCGHICSQLGLLGKAIPLRLLLVEESGFILATSNKNLKRKKTGIRNAKTQKHAEKEENQANTWVVGTTISRRAPLAWSRASSMVEILMSRPSLSILSE